MKDEPEIVDILFAVDSVVHEVGERVDVYDSLVGLPASGDPVPNADRDLKWGSRDPAVFTVEDAGRATGRDSDAGMPRTSVRGHSSGS